MTVAGSPALTVLNLSHPLTPTNRADLESALGQPVGRLIEVSVDLDTGAAFRPQVRRLIDDIGLSSTEWQSLPLVVHLPGLSPAAAVVLAELHARTGGFPPVVRLRRAEGAGQYELAEVIDLQEVREEARRARFSPES